MADNVFSSAPNSSGRQFGAVAGIAKLLGGGGKGNDYRQKSALQNESHTQKIQQAVVGHVLGETAADTAHGRTLRQNRQTHRLGQKAADAAHEREMAASTNLIDHFERLGSSRQYNNLNVSSKGISGTFKAPDKPDGVGEA
jgi:hypothetical protein